MNKITQCRECSFCKLIRTPDPDDWFNDDDETAYCKAMEAEIDILLRPHEDVSIPSWCPIKDTNIIQK